LAFLNVLAGLYFNISAMILGYKQRVNLGFLRSSIAVLRFDTASAEAVSKRMKKSFETIISPHVYEKTVAF